MKSFADWTDGIAADNAANGEKHHWEKDDEALEPRWQARADDAAMTGMPDPCGQSQYDMAANSQPDPYANSPYAPGSGTPNPPVSKAKPTLVFTGIGICDNCGLDRDLFHCNVYGRNYSCCKTCCAALAGTSI